jgi:thioredoxin-like negative regulator of GroEL
MSLGVTIVLQAALLATAGETYSEAHKATTEKGYPLVVVVGATWCPACKDLKDNVIPEVKRHGLLRNVAFAQVDLDQEHDLGAELTEGGPIPQIVVYRKTPLGWLLRRMVGGHDVKSVEEFIVNGIDADEKGNPKSSPAKDKPVKAASASAKTTADSKASPNAK